MTKKELKEIVKLKGEVKQLQEKLQELNYGDNETVVTDKVKGSMSHHPYSARSFTLMGAEQMSEACIKERDELGNKISEKYHELYKRLNDAYDYINGINDSEIRQIYVYRYIDGLEWNEIGEIMSYSGETVRKKHDNFMKSLPTYTDSKAV